jgi:peroxiredoxin
MPGDPSVNPERELGDVAMDVHQLWCGLVGKDVPPLTLTSAGGEQISFGGVEATLVVYIYPGGDISGQDGFDTRLADFEEYCGFRDLREYFAAKRFRVIGLSSRAAREVTESGQVLQLVPDPTLRLADLLRLPTCAVRGECFYRRLTLVLVCGNITHFYYPVNCPARHAADVLTSLGGPT